MVGMSIFPLPAYSQTQQGETLRGPDSRETGLGLHGHLFGEWGGERSRLLERGVNFDLLTIIPTLKKACMPSQSLRLATGNDVHGNTEL